MTVFCLLLSQEKWLTLYKDSFVKPVADFPKLAKRDGKLTVVSQGAWLILYKDGFVKPVADFPRLSKRDGKLGCCCRKGHR